jgi:hypothetical protein
LNATYQYLQCASNGPSDLDCRLSIAQQVLEMHLIYGRTGVSRDQPGPLWYTVAAQTPTQFIREASRLQEHHPGARVARDLTYATRRCARQCLPALLSARLH